MNLQTRSRQLVHLILITTFVLFIALTGCNLLETPTPAPITATPTLTSQAITPTLTSAPPTLTLTPTAPAPALGLFETPRDGPAPILNAIKNASKSIDVEIYTLTDTGIINALSDAHKAQKQVRVILNQKFPSGASENAATFQKLQTAGVAVKYANPAYTYTHEKAIVVDAGTATQKALIMTMNLAPSYLGEPDPNQGPSLNFGIIDSSASDIAQVEAMFNQDWNYQPYTPPALTPLVISPVTARARLLQQINDAKKSLHIFAQEFEDAQIVNAVIAAVKRGVEVRGIIANNFPQNVTQANKVIAAGGKMRYLITPYQHSKAMIADGTLVYIGSINYTANSMDHNRELGIQTAQPDIAAQMESEFEKFWGQASDKPK